MAPRAPQRINKVFVGWSTPKHSEFIFINAYSYRNSVFKQILKQFLILRGRNFDHITHIIRNNNYGNSRLLSIAFVPSTVLSGLVTLSHSILNIDI